MDIKRTSFLTIIYITTLACLASLFFFGMWSISAINLIINGYESIGLSSPPPESLWKERKLFKLVVGSFGWVSLIALFLMKNRNIKQISPVWFVGIASGIYISSTWYFNSPSLFSYPPIILSILLITFTYLNKPNNTFKRDAKQHAPLN